MLAIDASRQRMELAGKAKVLELGLDAAATIKATNSREKMLAHQMAAAHTAAMEAQANALDLMQRFKRTSCIHQHLSIEAGRMFNGTPNGGTGHCAISLPACAMTAAAGLQPRPNC